MKCLISDNELIKEQIRLYKEGLNLCKGNLLSNETNSKSFEQIENKLFKTKEKDIEASIENLSDTVSCLF